MKRKRRLRNNCVLNNNLSMSSGNNFKGLTSWAQAWRRNKIYLWQVFVWEKSIRAQGFQFDIFILNNKRGL